MDFEPERIEFHYLVRYYVPGRKHPITTKWKMSEAEAVKKFAGQKYELVLSSREERRIGGDPLKSSMAFFNTGRSRSE